MARVAVQLVISGAKHAIDVVGEAADDIQQTTFAGGLEEGDTRFNHVPGAVQFVAFGEVGPALLWRFDREICIQIAIFTLGGRDQFNHLIGGFFQPGVRLLTQRPGHRLQPFRHVAVLKDHAVEFALLSPGGDAEVLYRMARVRLLDTVVKRIPLIRDHHIAHQLLVLAEERVVDFQFVQIDFHNRHGGLLKAEHDAYADRWRCAPSSDC